jgi:hypothetical protein
MCDETSYLAKTGRDSVRGSRRWKLETGEEEEHEARRFVGRGGSFRAKKRSER